MALCLVSLVLISIWIKLLAFHIFLNVWLLNFDNNVVIVFRILLVVSSDISLLFSAKTGFRTTPSRQLFNQTAYTN